MKQPPGPPVKVAVLDLYNGKPNQGIPSIRELLTRGHGRFYGQGIAFDVFETRLKDEAPGLDYDLYISSGGPGSPYDGEGRLWENRYFHWLDAVWNHNERHPGDHVGTDTKHVLFICHSYQMMARFFEVAAVVKRRSESFGIFPIHRTDAGQTDPLFERLDDPFYAADFRHWQVVQPDRRALDDLDAEVLALEKIRPHVPLEQATMAMRLSPELVGVQFHPEAHPPGMRKHFLEPERMEYVVRRHGEAKYQQFMQRLDDPAYLKRTHGAVIPDFLQRAIETLRPEAVTD